jgi:hypothetical protein
MVDKFKPTVRKRYKIRNIFIRRAFINQSIMAKDFIITKDSKHPRSYKGAYKGSFAQNPILKEEWITAIEQNSYWTWDEDTEQNKSAYEAWPEQPKKVRACAEHDLKKGYYKFSIGYYENFQFISLADWPRETKKYVTELYKLAQSLNANLIKGTKIIIDEAYIENLK